MSSGPRRKAEPPGSGGAGAANKEENVYIPSFISKKPFYAGDGGEEEDNDYLKHQRREESKETSTWYNRGRKAGPAATKYRKGACENCGAMTHKAKDCLSRPRAKGAKWTGKDIQADEVIEDVKLGWDAKRDRWNGYNAEEYRNVVEEYKKIEELRDQSRKSQNLETDTKDLDRYAEENDMSKHQSTATRQLRIREDTAKYLVNLDLDSARYDPKIRALVDGGATGGKSAQAFAEEAYVRGSGEAAEFEKAQRYAWEAQERAGDTSQHLQANPTAGAMHRRKEREEAERVRIERDAHLLKKYGGDGQKQMPAALRSMVKPDSEVYVEYDEAGLIKGAPRQVGKSKYAEDVLTNNHTSVWGSWWSNFKWGYACCHSLAKNSYCTGEEGKQAWEAAERHRMGVDLLKALENGEAGIEGKEELKIKGNDQRARKRTLEEMNGVSEAELDEYRRKRAVADDPMSKFLGKDELVS